MKLTLTTAIATALIATGAIAETDKVSRGAENAKSGEVAMMPFASVDADADTWVTEDEYTAAHDNWSQSRGAGNETGPEMAMDPEVMSFADMDEDGDGRLSEDEYIKASTAYDPSRGAQNTTGAEEENKKSTD